MYTIFGYIKDKNNAVVKNAKVYPYFKKIDSGSDASKWADTEYSTDSNGYFSFDIEDAALLDVTGSYKKGSDKVYIAVVYDNLTGINQELDATDMTHVLFYSHTTRSATDFHELNLSIESKRVPIITSNTFPAVNILTQHEYTMSETSLPDYSWKSSPPYTDNDISQKAIYDLVTIFDKHVLTDTVYNWVEIPAVSVSNNSQNKHTYEKAGVYNLSIQVRELWGTMTEVSQQVTVRYNEPNMDFDWSPTLTNNWEGSKIKGPESITFTNRCNDLDDRCHDVLKWSNEVYSYSWTITDTLQDGSDNTQVYTGKEWGYQPEHQFQSTGVKTITLVVSWNDGFVNHTKSVVKTITIHPFNIVPDFVWDKVPTNRNDTVNLSSTTTGDTNKISQYDWVVEDEYPVSTIDHYTFLQTESSIFNEGSSDNTKVVDNTYTLNDTPEPSIKLHSTGSKMITLTIHYHNGWRSVTKSISKSITPLKYTTEPAFTISNPNPQGRDVEVVMTNTTSYTRDGVNIAYNIDWILDDYFTSCNLDNPSGIILDNSVSMLDQVSTTVLKHMFQNTNSNDVELVMRYDDGYQLVTKKLTKSVTPIVYPAPTPDFTWDITTPISREDKVTFQNTTNIDRFRSYDWTIPDSYNKHNPDSPNYGAVVDNSKVYTNETDSNFTPQHNFQDNITRTIEMVFHYDDGFCDRTVTKRYDISFNEYTLTPIISTNLQPINGGFYGKVEILYSNTSTGNAVNRQLEEEWAFNDRVFGTEDDNIKLFSNVIIGDDIPYTYTTPSRKPYSAINGSSGQNLNKQVNLNVIYDNGWSDNNTVMTNRSFEATPCEVSSSINYQTNITNYQH